MEKIANYIQKFTDLVNKYGIAFHSFSVVFWIWILYLNVNNPNKENTFLRISFYITIVFILLSSFNLVLSVLRKFKKN